MPQQLLEMRVAFFLGPSLKKRYAIGRCNSRTIGPMLAGPADHIIQFIHNLKCGRAVALLPTPAKAASRG